MNCELFRNDKGEIACRLCGRPIAVPGSIAEKIGKDFQVVRRCLKDHKVPCDYLGGERRREACPTCTGNVQVKVFACEKFSEATLIKPLAGLSCCAVCGEYKSAQ